MICPECGVDIPDNSYYCDCCLCEIKSPKKDPIGKITGYEAPEGLYPQEALKPLYRMPKLGVQECFEEDCRMCCYSKTCPYYNYTSKSRKYK